MRYLIILITQFLLITAHASSDLDQQLFARPLILGASVSRGHGTTDGGPASVLSKMINSSATVTNKSISGRTSFESTRGFDLFATNPTIIIALDLFFWDAVRERPGFEENTRRLFRAFQEKKVPMIVGLVPIGVKFPEGIRLVGERPAAAKINQLLEKLCTIDKNCILYDAKTCFDQMDGPKEYFSDSLHTTNSGNKFCADIFVNSRDYRKLRAANI